MQVHCSSIRRYLAACSAMAAMLGVAAVGSPMPAHAAPIGGTAIIQVSKSAPFVSSLVPGGTANYTVGVTNFGLSAATGARLADPTPAGLANPSWSCVGMNGAVCAFESGVGDIDEALDGLIPNGTLEFFVVADVDVAPPPYITNVASVSLPAGATCSDASTPPCRAQVTLGTGAAIDMNLSATAEVLSPGGSAQYFLTLDSLGTDASGTSVRVPQPNGLQGMSWTCNASSGAVCPASGGSGSIDLVIGTWPVGGQLIFGINATVSANPPAEIVTSAIAVPPYGGSCGIGGTQPPCIASVRQLAGAQIDITKSGELQLVPDTIEYTLSVFNSGADAGGTVIADPLPAGVSAFTWTCSATDGVTCPAASGIGPINAVVPSWPTGNGLVYTITAQVAPGAPPVIVNTASATPPAGGVCGIEATPPPCVASDSTLLVEGALSIEKYVDTGGMRGGGMLDFIVVASNFSDVSANGSVLGDPLPPGIASFDFWTCSAFKGATCPAASGSGPLAETIVNFPPGSSLTYLIATTLDAAPPSMITNTATLTPPAGSSIGCSGPDPLPPCEASVSVPSGAVFAVGKFADTAGIEPGGTIGYRLDVFNLGMDATNVLVSDPVPAGIASMTWTCSGKGAECPAPSGSGSLSELLSLLPGDAGISYDVSATLAASLPPSVTNTLTVTSPDPNGCLIGDTATVTPSPCITSVTNNSIALLELEKVADRSQLLRGGVVQYTVVLRNEGGNAAGSVLSDPLPAGIDRFDWTCVAFAGAICPAFSGSGALNETIATLPANGYLVYSVTAVVAQDAPASITNIASVTVPAGGACVAAGCAASVTLPVSLVPAANIGITKSADTGTAAPGTTVNYDVQVTNLGDTTSASVVVSDPLPTGVTSMSWTCSGVECPNASGVGAISETLPSLAPYYEEYGAPRPGRVTYRIAAVIDSAPPATINNIATVAPSAGDTCAAASCTATSSLPTGVAGALVLTITQGANAASLVPGGTVDYTVTLANSGPDNAGPTTISDAVPTGIASFAWTCAAAGGASCPAASGVGAINAVVPGMPAGGALTYTISAVVGPTPPTNIVNAFVVTPPASATCVPAGCVSTLSIPVVAPPQPLLAITKSADRAELEPGGNVQYTVSVSNTGTGPAGAAQLSDPIPAGIATVAWTCAAINGAICPAASGTGALNATFNLVPGARLIWTLQAVIVAAPPATVTNVASLVPPAGVPCNPTACTAQVALPTAALGVPAVQVAKSVDPPAGTQVSAGQAIDWTVSIANADAPTTGVVTVTDRLPANVRDVLVSPAAGISCNSTAPAAGSNLVCTLGAGFVGELDIGISAVVTGADAQGVVRNVVEAAGIDNPACTTCSVSNPVGLPFDLALRNARPYSAAGIQGVLVDVVNLTPTAATAVPVVLAPASARRLFGVSSGACTASGGSGGSPIVVTCPNPPSAQGVNCAGATCTIARLAQNGAITLFVALNAGAGATLTVDVPGDGDPANNTLVLEARP